MIFSPDLSGVVEINVIQYELSGNPSCVFRAQLEFIYADGRAIEYLADYGPNGIIFESFQLSLEALRKRLKLKEN